MQDLEAAFEERLAEVETYLEFLEVIEEQARRGPPKLEGADHPISVQQQKILYASLYLQLYNLVESTMTRCIDSVAAAAANNGSWQAKDLSMSMRAEWVRVMARTHVDLTYHHRLENALKLCEHLVGTLPISEFAIEKGGGGNWDDQAIEDISRRLGFRLQVSNEVYRGIKRPFRDDMGPLTLVKDLRNRLAHGSISFTECAGEVTVSQLKDLKEKTVNYLHEVVLCFTTYIDGFEYLIPERRPARQE